MKEMTLNNIYLYRMLHIDNVPHILEHGITHRLSKNSNPNYIKIGDESLINLRTARFVCVTNGEKILLGDFIPFYFGVRMPMLYVIQHGGNFVEKAYSSDSIIYVAVNLQTLISSGCSYYFSDGHATDNLTTFYDSSMIESLPNIIDLDAIRARKWSGEEVETDIKRRKQAEFLVGQDISPDLIYGFVCCSQNSREVLVSMGVKSNIRIFPEAYYL